MTEPAPSPPRRLEGWREHVADTLRHLVALVLSCVVVLLLAVGPSSVLDGTRESLVWLALLVLVLTVVTVLGHGLVTWLRGRVSVVRSALLTWLVLTILLALPMLGAGVDMMLVNLVLGVPRLTVVVLLQTVLRVFVPPFQVRAGGVRVRPVMSSADA